jgi:hypothetical protein
VRQARATAKELGVTIDNVEEFRLRLDGRAGVKNDLAGAGWNSLCVYTMVASIRPRRWRASPKCAAAIWHVRIARIDLEADPGRP